MAEVISNYFVEPLESTETVGGAIDIYRAAFPSPSKAIETLERAVLEPDIGVCWSQAAVGNTNNARTDKKIRSNKNLSVSDEAYAKGSKPLQQIHNTFYNLLLRATLAYQKKYGIHEPLFHESYVALRYQTGEEYKAHYDGTTASGRFLSAITYLNDDYNGGELEFPNFGVKIKPREGDLFLFPSNYAYAHIAHPVTSGTKYAIVTWIHDRPVEG